jgi:hypothetical protein
MTAMHKDKTLQKLEAKLERGTYSGEDSEWTLGMKGLFTQMAVSMGYKVEDESRVHGGKRADQRWLSGRASAVAIEHENRDNLNLDGEINKLCNDVSTLKVLFAYPADTDFEERCQRLNKRVIEAINNHIDTFTGEFLLVVSGWYTQPKDKSWKAYRSVLRSSLEPIS